MRETRIPARPRSSGVPRLVALCMALICPVTSGCMTTLGYVPGYVDKRSEPPKYEEVRSWAAKVREGYDTRMTANRYAGYYGALLAAGAAGAVTGLAAFDAGSSAIIGIPIGTAFLASVFGVFQNEDKAKVYGHASRYVSDLIAQSDHRVSERDGAYLRPDVAKAAADRSQAAVMKARDEAKTRLKDLQRYAAEDLKAVAETTDPVLSKVRQERATASQKLVTEAEKALSAAEAKVDAANRRVEHAQARLDRGPITDDTARKHLAQRAEAVCLERDVLEVTARVANLLYPLAPSSADALKAVKAPADTKKGDAKDTTADGKPKEKPALPSLADFDLPADSTCADDV